jgi:hypothetical protein
MNSTQDLQNAVKTAQQMVAERLVIAPKFGVYIHARDQLNKIDVVLKASQIPTEPQKNEIDIALMAVKELEGSEPELADTLCMVDYLYKKLK